MVGGGGRKEKYQSIFHLPRLSSAVTAKADTGTNFREFCDR